MVKRDDLQSAVDLANEIRREHKQTPRILWRRRRMLERIWRNLMFSCGDHIDAQVDSFRSVSPHRQVMRESADAFWRMARDGLA